MAKELAISAKTYDLASPDAMSKMGKVLKDYVVKQKLYTNIKGKNYAHVEGWQFAGGLLGLFPVITETIDLSKPNEVKWKAICEIIEIKSGKVVGRGEALCSSKEGLKKSFDEYAILSMAQTRSIGKAFRNMIGWVMKLAGYESTPSEEMHKVGETVREASDDVVHVPADVKDYSCSRKGCGNEISKAEHDFSMKVYKRPLCREHQKEAKAAK